MSKTMIIVDTCSDIPAELTEDFDMELLATTFDIDDRYFNEGIDFSKENFYEILPAPKGKIKSFYIPSAVYLDRYKNAATCGYENVIVFTIGGEDEVPMTASATEAADLFKEQNPTSDLRIVVVPVNNYSISAGLIALDAAKLANNGASFDDILSNVNSNISRMTMLVDAFNVPPIYNDPTFKWRKWVSFSGSYHPFPALKICNGKAVELPIIKGDHSAFDQFYAYCVEALRAEKPEYAIGYASRAKEARGLALLLEEELGYPPIALYQLGAISAYGASKASLVLCYKAPSIENQLKG